jgi:hypothetical protein|tara:strand:+ start:930 stop:1121 length:192 start_codon:yes stop_codon:yes gene_type:complete
MTKRQFVSSKGDTWEWEETPELVKALHKLSHPEYMGDYQGPLYAPHPELKKPNQRPTTDSTEK